MIIFLYGPDTFRSLKKLQALKDKFIAEVDKSALNIAVLDGSSLVVEEFQKAISTPPFLAKKRMVIVKDLIAKNKGQKIQKEILELLSNNKLDSTILIFWEGDIQIKSKKSRSKTSIRRSHLLFDRLAEEKFAQEFNLLNDRQIETWVVGEIKSRGGEIEPQAVTVLASLVGNDLWQLNGEIDKLLSFCNNKSITVQDVKSLVKTKFDDDIFKLTDALGQNNKALAFKLINDQLESGNNPSELLSRIVWQYKNLLLVKDFVTTNGIGYSAQRLAFQIKLHPFVVKKLLGQINHHNYKSLKNTYQRLAKIDYQIKTSQTDPQTLFDLLVAGA